MVRPFDEFLGLRLLPFHNPYLLLHGSGGYRSDCFLEREKPAGLVIGIC